VVPDRYRVKIQWTWSPEGEEPVSQWATYELNGPPSSMANVGFQAGQLAQASSYWVALTNESTPSITDYEMEQI
jgi:hypothetical protein